MHWSSPWFIILLSTGAIFLFAGALMHFLPPRKINMIYGYRTKRSMKDQESWDFAQRRSAAEMIRLGLALISTSTLGWILPMSDTLASTLTIALIVLGTILMIRRTELAIKHWEGDTDEK